MNDLKALASQGYDFVEGTPAVENEVAAVSKYMRKNGSKMAVIQEKPTKVHNNITPLCDNLIENETRLSFSSELIASKNSFFFGAQGYRAVA